MTITSVWLIGVGFQPQKMFNFARVCKKRLKQERNSMIRKITYKGQTFVFNGHNNNGLSRFVLEVVRSYITEHKKITFNDLKEVFPDTLQDDRNHRKGTQLFGVFEKIEKAVERGNDRYFFTPADQIKLCDDTTIVVCTQWGQVKKGNNSLPRFVNYVNEKLEIVVNIEYGRRN